MTGNSMNKKHERLAYRLAEILIRLNQGERLDIHELAETHEVSVRTMQRDLNERFSFLEWNEQGSRYYSLNKAKLGHLSMDDIRRFAHFASIQDLFPEADRHFFQEKLTQGIRIKGFQYEDISNHKDMFDRLNKAIHSHQRIHFHYTKTSDNSSKYYELEPYCLLNKNGIWYVVGIDGGKKKTFCFTQMASLDVLLETFAVNQQLVDEIKHTDSISYGNQISEVVVQVAPQVAGYFLRRDLLPNQELIRKLETGGLLLASKNVHEMEIVPIVRFWIPNLRIVSPESLQSRMEEGLEQYLNVDMGHVLLED